MMFCPECGSLLKTKKVDEKTHQVCSCGFTTEAEHKKITENVDTNDDIAIIEDIDNVNPLADATCEKCGHNKAYWWLQQTRSGDEPETKFFKCEKCKHTWREYD
ncbi:MAG: transcription factor S [Candidatus Nanoarchaeia archaeon]